MRKLIVLLLFLFLVPNLEAQTTTTPAKTTPALVQLPGIPNVTGSVFVVLPDGRLAQADLEGLVLIPGIGGARPILAAKGAAAAVNFVDNETLTLNTGSTLDYTLAKPPIAGSLKVYRNGLRQRLGIDYTLEGQVVKFIPWYTGDVSALVTADYRTP